ncbi:hypothetical protein GZH53_02655 [Flavihumibacter sp. R14]|nr:hypothetical protein [Flavihumibacter soli]
MHFGKIVKRAAYSSGYSADEFAYMMGITEVELLHLYEQTDWKSGDIRLASQILKYDFGKYFNQIYLFDFMPEGHKADTEELNITIKYPKGKEFLLKSWLQKMVLVARAIGLQMGN